MFVQSNMFVQSDVFVPYSDTTDADRELKFRSAIMLYTQYSSYTVYILWNPFTYFFRRKSVKVATGPTIYCMDFFGKTVKKSINI